MIAGAGTEQQDSGQAGLHLISSILTHQQAATWVEDGVAEELLHTYRLVD